MGFYKNTYLRCDEQTNVCEYYGTNCHFDTIAKYKPIMKATGWHFKGKKACCPSCWNLLNQQNNDQSKI